VSNLITKKEGGSYDDSEQPTKRVRVERRYRRYSKIGHNSRTYKVEIEDVEYSNASK
jgi:hypothetical protein